MASLVEISEITRSYLLVSNLVKTNRMSIKLGCFVNRVVKVRTTEHVELTSADGCAKLEISSRFFLGFEADFRFRRFF